jgi:superfamily II RNA helicase
MNATEYAYTRLVDLGSDPTPVLEGLEEREKTLFGKFTARFPFELDRFQKFAVAALLQGDNVLVTVPTSSGKTLIAEFGIYSCLMARKKIVYTSPIKTLSNQKYSEFREKFSCGEIGIITGDVKFNPEANCLIMTTEILRDLLFRGDPIVDQLGMVIFDEVHYINNDDRGHVWEQCLMLLPSHIQLILLSATISRPELFAKWIGAIKKKTVHLIVHTNRPVPLMHYLYRMSEDEMVPYHSSQKFDSGTYQDYFQSFQTHNETSAINQLVKTLKRRDLCPALFFTFSRQKCEQLAERVTECFHGGEEQAGVEKEINQLLCKYQYGFNTLKDLPQIDRIKQLAIRGIAFHHSGLLPFSKEIVEILFSKGMIKVMFVTETFSVGINMPTRTVVFTDLSKNVGGNVRLLQTDEFYQMAGRAGRRGLDKQGYVIYAPIRRVLSLQSIRSILEGSPMAIRSRYQVDYSIILQQISNNQPYELVQRSYLFQELQQFVDQKERELSSLDGDATRLQDELEQLDLTEEQVNLVDQWNRLSEQERLPQAFGGFAVQLDGKAQKRIRAQKQKLRTEMKQAGMTDGGKTGLLPEFQRYAKLTEELGSVEKRRRELIQILADPESGLKDKYQHTVDVLRQNGYLKVETEQPTAASLTDRGLAAAAINNADGILVAELIESSSLDRLSAHHLGLVLSLLTTELSSKHEMTLEDCPMLKDDCDLRQAIALVKRSSEALKERFPFYPDQSLPADLLEATDRWLKGAKYGEIANHLGELQGNFVRSMLRLLRLCEELIGTCQKTGRHLSLEKRLQQLLPIVNRDIIVFDSIYIK